MPTKHPGYAICGILLVLALAGCKVEETGGQAADAPPVASQMARGPGPASQPPLYLLGSNRVVDPKDRYTVNATRAPFFTNGPAQTQGADFSLHKGDTVAMVQRDYGYSKVRTANGREGYVATDQLTPVVPLPAEEAAVMAPPGSLPASQLSQPLKVPPLDQMVSDEEPPLPTGGATTATGTTQTASTQ